MTSRFSLRIFLPAWERDGVALRGFRPSAPDLVRAYLLAGQRAAAGGTRSSGLTVTSQSEEITKAEVEAVLGNPVRQSSR